MLLNQYAFVQVAVYGKDYITGGKDTWQLVKYRGVDAIINDSLISTILSVGALLTGVISAAVCYSVFYFWDAMQQGPGYAALVVVLSFVTGLAEFSIITSVIDAGVTTTFVCL